VSPTPLLMTSSSLFMYFLVTRANITDWLHGLTNTSMLRGRPWQFWLVRVHDEDERQILVHLVNVIIATNLVRGLEFFVQV
jgi:hypothetical protein